MLESKASALAVKNVYEIISRYVESNLTGFQNLSGLVLVG